MPAWLIGIAATILIGAAATAWLWMVRRRSDELQAGLESLSAMRWRDFSRIVLAAMERRGLRLMVPEQGNSPEPGTGFALTRNGEQWLLACKHGSAYRIGAAPVEELAASVRLGGAAGGILATDGWVEKAGRDAAQANGIEVVDGRRLWPAVKPLMEAGELERIVGGARARARRHIGISWLAAVTVGLLLGLGLAGTRPDPPDDRPVGAPDLAAAPQAAPAPVVYAPFVEPTEAEMQQQREAVSNALTLTPGIARALWNTRLTLSVDRSNSEAEAWAIVCREVELYPALRTVRVQLNPPLGSDEPVRWRQCKTM
ncbi:MAG: restriction endonuclease [Pseudoxanthomonas sp.]|nr:restriction endonuclease [Pseudoxanthomonas sp.]